MDKQEQNIGPGALMRQLGSTRHIPIVEKFLWTSSNFTPEERRVLKLLFLDHHSRRHEEAAKEMGIPLKKLQELEASAIGKLQAQFGKNE